MPKPPKNFRPDPFDYHHELDLRVDTLTNLGHGLGRVDGWVVMVPFALPGELVRARIYRNHKNYSDADLLEVLEPSPDRVEPKCALFGRCGGCQYQNLAYPEQLAWKRGQVRELLEHLAGLEGVEVEPVIGSPRQFRYRSKITPHFQKPRDGEIGPIGFLHAAKRFEIVDVPACPIASDAIGAKLGETREKVRAKAETYRKGATLLLRETAGGVVLTDSQEICEETVGELKFRFLAGDFFQNNPAILPKFVDYVRNRAAASQARFLIDAYCGSGLFALSCAADFEAVAGVEVSEGSIAWARENAKLNGIQNATFHLGSAESIFAAANAADPGGDRGRHRSAAQRMQRRVFGPAVRFFAKSGGLRLLQSRHANARLAPFHGCRLRTEGRATVRPFPPNPAPGMRHEPGKFRQYPKNGKIGRTLTLRRFCAWLG